MDRRLQHQRTNGQLGRQIAIPFMQPPRCKLKSVIPIADLIALFAPLEARFISRYPRRVIYLLVISHPANGEIFL